MLFRSRRSRAADPERELELAEGRSTEELIEELESLTRENQERPDADNEVKLVALRHAVGIRRLDEAQKGAVYPEPAFDRLPDRNGDLAGVERDQLSPEVLRAGILRDGCLLIRGAVPGAEGGQVIVRPSVKAAAQKLRKKIAPAKINTGTSNKK
jgi:hypothetical protein